MIRQMDNDAVEAVRDRRAGRTPGLIVGPEHEVIDEELRTPAEQIRQRGTALVGFEIVLLVDPDPGQLLPTPRQLVAFPCELFLCGEQLDPGRMPFFACPDLVCPHGSCLPPRVSLSCAPRALYRDALSPAPFFFLVGPPLTAR